MVEYLPSKQATWVRFPSPALRTGLGERGVSPEREATRDREGERSEDAADED